MSIGAYMKCKNSLKDLMDVGIHNLFLDKITSEARLEQLDLKLDGIIEEDFFKDMSNWIQVNESELFPVGELCYIRHLNKCGSPYLFRFKGTEFMACAGCINKVGLDNIYKSKFRTYVPRYASMESYSTVEDVDKIKSEVDHLVDVIFSLNYRLAVKLQIRDERENFSKIRGTEFGDADAFVEDYMVNPDNWVPLPRKIIPSLDKYMGYCIIEDCKKSEPYQVLRLKCSNKVFLCKNCYDEK
jgi:hypothetical protein